MIFTVLCREQRISWVKPQASVCCWHRPRRWDPEGNGNACSPGSQLLTVGAFSSRCLQSQDCLPTESAPAELYPIGRVLNLSLDADVHNEPCLRVYLCVVTLPFCSLLHSKYTDSRLLSFRPVHPTPRCLRVGLFIPLPSPGRSWSLETVWQARQEGLVLSSGSVNSGLPSFG